MNNFFSKRDGPFMGKVLLFLGLMLALFVTMLFANEIRLFFAGTTDVTKMATIDVTGTGYTFAIPNIATESFTIEQEADTVADAQATVTQKVNAATAFLKTSGIAATDIQTTDYSANPEYSYPAPCTTQACPQTAPTIVGYTVSDSMTVKIRDTSTIGTIVTGLGQLGVTGLSGPDFTVDDMDSVDAVARANAITDAEQKAQVLSKQLGVRLVRIVNFSEDAGPSTPSPMLYAASGTALSAPATPPVVSVGQNKYTSNVTITYEIK